ncbi:MAG: redox-sensitive transcriptional activator SoxR [Actinomycetota bacterium]
MMPIGEVARRTGVAASALRFYEAEGLIWSERLPSGRRRYPSSLLRRISFVRVAQRVGLSLDDIKAALASLPQGRTPTKTDWARLSRSWRPRLEERLAALLQLRDQLTECIGCGCLSLRTCALYNPKDAAASLGAGPRYLLGDRPEDVVDPRT